MVFLISAFELCLLQRVAARARLIDDLSAARENSCGSPSHSDHYRVVVKTVKHTNERQENFPMYA